MTKRKKTFWAKGWVLVTLLVLAIGIVFTGAIALLHETAEWIDEALYFPKDEEHPEQLKYAEWVEAASAEFGVEEAIIYAVIYCESDFDQRAVSSVGAQGLMQMMPKTFKELQGYLGETYDDDALFEPQISIRYGAFYLSRMYDRFGDWELAFAAYNAGPTTVSQWLKDESYSQDGKLVRIPYEETESYVKKVTETVEKYKEYYPMEVQK